jgi:hypothetical protein
MEYDDGARYVLGQRSSVELLGREANAARLKHRILRLIFRQN